MTETLGWGDVDVDEEPRRRRRLPVVLIWVVVVGVIGAVGIWPSTKDKLADHAASWLQHEWQLAGQYESSRSDIELAASQRVATGDTPALVGLVQALDREEAGKLTALATAIVHHRTWTASVASVGKAVRQAFLAEAGDLKADVAVAPKVLPTSLYVENPYSSKTDGLVERASTRMAFLQHSRHLKPGRAVNVALTSAADIVVDLQRVTAAPVDLRLALMHGAQLDVWDLRTGQVRKNVVGYLPINPPTGVLPVAGASVLAQFEASWQLWPSSGPRPVELPYSEDTSYAPDYAGGVWRSEQGRIRRYDAVGRPSGPWHAYPADVEMGAAATADAIVTNRGPLNFTSPHPVLWYPDTGRFLPFEDACAGSYATARWTVAFTSCDGSRVTLLDTRSGRTTTVRLPRGLVVPGTNPVLSGDGTKMAVQAHLQGDDSSTRLLVYDLTKPGVTQVATSATPLTWSASGSVLLLDMNSEDPAAPTTTVGTAIYAPLAYWQPDMKEPAGIRINLSDGSFAVAAIP